MQFLICSEFLDLEGQGLMEEKTNWS